MDYSYLKAYRFFSGLLTQEEKYLLDYMYKSMSSTSVQLSDSIVRSFDKSRLIRLEVLINTINVHKHHGFFSYICSIILARDNSIIIKEAPSFPLYGISNYGYIQYNNGHKYDRTFLGRLDCLRKYVIKNIEDSHEI